MDSELLKEFEKKEHEIYLENLIVDLENNFDILSLSIKNLLIFYLNENISYLRNLNTNCDYKMILEDYYKKFEEFIIKKLEDRKTYLKTQIESDQYIDILNKMTLLLLDDINNEYSRSIKIVDDMGSDDFNNKRIHNYFCNDFYDRIMLKLNTLLRESNMLLVNYYNDNVNKYIIKDGIKK